MPGLAAATAVVVQAEPRQAAGLEVLDDDVGPAGELLGQRQVVRGP